MTRCWIQLGKYGDILSFLPIAWKHWKMTGEREVVVIAREFADIQFACQEYVYPIIWEGHWQDLEGAIKEEKRWHNNVVVPQTYGKTVAIKHNYPSFQLDQWSRAGELHSWDKLPLKIERPKNASEIVSRVLGSRPSILFADHSESSPAPFADRLGQLLEKEFPDYQIVRLSTVRLEKFCDCIALYDASKAIVVTETAHLHLSKATTTPVFAFATSTPSLWHGSAWSKCFRFYARYHQYERVEHELVEKIMEALICANEIKG